MNVQLEAIEWDGPEAYRVSFEGGGEEVGPTIGHVWRQDGSDAWRFSMRDPMDATDPTAANITAENIDALRELIAVRFRAVEIPNDRLSNERMHELTGQMLVVLSILAKRSSARPGYIAALAGAVARAVVTDLKPEGEAAFMAAFDIELKNNIATLRTMSGVHKAFAHTFAELFKPDTDDDDNAPRH